MPLSASRARQPSGRSGRAVATAISGACRSPMTRCTRSSSGSSPQWRSSSTISSGWSRASAARKSIHASCRRSRAARGWRSPAMSRPSVRPRIGRGPSRSTTVAGGSLSKSRSAERRTSASGAYVIPRPYDGQRPIRRSGGGVSPSSRSEKARARAVLPTPASPMSVTSRGLRSSTASRYVSTRE